MKKDVILNEVLTLSSGKDTDIFCNSEYANLQLPFFEILRGKDEELNRRMFNKNYLYQFKNLPFFCWAFGNAVFNVDFKEVVGLREKKGLSKVFSVIFGDEEYEYIHKKRNIFKDVIKLYLLTIIPKVIVDRNLKFNYEELKEIIINNLIGDEKEKIKIDEVVEELNEEVFKKAIEYVKEKNYEKLTNLIKENFEAGITKQSLTTTDIFLILNAYSYKERKNV